MHRLLPMAVLGLLWLSAIVVTAANPKAEIATYSPISIDLDSLSNGTIQIGRGVALKSARGLTTQVAFIVKKPLSYTTNFLINWDPSSHPEMDTYQSFNFRHEAEANFDAFKFTRTDRPTKLLMEYTLKSRNHTNDLHLTAGEFTTLQNAMGALPDRALEGVAFQQTATAFWTAVLKDRFNLYKKGGVAALPTLHIGGNKFNVGEQLRSMLSDSAAIRARFHDLLDTTCLRETPTPPIEPATYYWQLFKADTIATLCMGAIYALQTPESSKVLDLQYYVSNSYITSATLYELFPLAINGEDCTLIWRIDYVSAPAFNTLRGVEQMAADMLMSQSIKQAMQFFIADINASK